MKPYRRQQRQPERYLDDFFDAWYNVTIEAGRILHLIP